MSILLILDCVPGFKGIEISGLSQDFLKGDAGLKE